MRVLSATLRYDLIFRRIRIRIRIATATIIPRVGGSIVEARGSKVLPISAQSCAWRWQGRGLQVAEMSK
jgi:hypothetical protein